MKSGFILKSFTVERDSINMAVRKLRVLIVDDSLVFREFLKRGISSDAGMEVVAVAASAFEARDAIEELEPDVMALDVEMPRLNGIDFLKILMPQYPMPVVVVSAVSGNVFDAMEAGAVDFVTKPDARTPEAQQSFINELLIKLKIASTAKVSSMKQQHHSTQNISYKAGGERHIVAIGASTGGTEALQSVIQDFDRDGPAIVIVQHMPPVFTRMYAERLDRSCKMAVREAKNGDVVEKGLVLIAPGSMHMRLIKTGDRYTVQIKEGEKVSGHCPSVDVLFDSVAKAAGNKAVGVILTGMGSDGAKGLLNMRKAGAYTVGQDEASSVVYGMPMVAMNIGSVMRQVSLENVPATILRGLTER